MFWVKRVRGLLSAMASLSRRGTVLEVVLCVEWRCRPGPWWLRDWEEQESDGIKLASEALTVLGQSSWKKLCRTRRVSAPTRLLSQRYAGR